MKINPAVVDVQSVQQEPVQQLPDLAAMYPAIADDWRSMTALSVNDAVLLSLGIDPKPINEIRSLELSSAASALDLVDATVCMEIDVPPAYFGQQHEEFERRTSATVNAMDAGVLQFQNGVQSHSRLIFIEYFCVWALSKGWLIPDWMELIVKAETKRSTILVASDAGESLHPIRKLSPQAERSKQTEKRHSEWKRLAIEINKKHHDITAMQVARKVVDYIELNFSSYNREFGGEVPSIKTIQNEIRDLSSLAREESNI